MNSHKLILALGWFTLLFFPFISIMVLYYVSGSWLFIFKQGWPIWYQVPVGIALGLALGFSLRKMLKTTYFSEITHKYGHLLDDFQLTRPEYIFLSVCAGFGEEILFRGCVQYYAGILPTAFLFVALHGYLNPMNRKILLYGITLTGVFVGVGYLMQFAGLYVCIMLHIVIDIILFDHLLGTKNKI